MAQRLCFLVSPIGREGTDKYRTFKEVMDYVIKPAVRSANLDLQVIRADDIQRPGSFVKGILEHLLNAHVVIADMTGQNPNVFYELGVRHALSPRTVLIAQSIDDIPSDLREYRTIIYSTSARGAASFAKKLRGCLREIEAEPNHPDNPVLDRLGSKVKKNKEKKDDASFIRELNRALAQDSDQPRRRPDEEPLSTRLERILKLSGADRAYPGSSVVYEEAGGKKEIVLPTARGPFQLYYIMEEERITGYWYLAQLPAGQSADRLFPDIRVLMAECSSKPRKLDVTFVVTTGDNLAKQRATLQRHYTQLKQHVHASWRTSFSFDLWDSVRLQAIEEELGLRLKVRSSANRKSKGLRPN